MTLAEFHSENDIGTRRGAGNSGIALADVRSRRVPIEWFEAVAIVQELCGALLESPVGSEKASLSPKDVFIDQAGGVRVAQDTGEKGEPPMRQIGELLRTSLAESAFPVPLRLVMTQACSTPPFYASIRELSSALEYFERPDRPGLIRAVYERAQGYQPLSAAVTQATPESEAEKPANRDKRQPRRIPKTAIAASAAAVTLMVFLLVVSRIEIVSSVGPLVDRVNPFTPSLSTPPNPALDSPKTVDAPPQLRSAKAGGRTPRSSPPTVRTAARTETPQADKVSAGDTLQTTEAVQIEAVEMLPTADPPDAAPEKVIYSANDVDVTPPVAAYPRLPAEPPTRIAASDLSTLELLVGENGLVEAVRLVAPPRHLGEALLVTMNLSAAKTWRFLPAVKDGRPVKYRKLVQVWPSTP